MFPFLLDKHLEVESSRGVVYFVGFQTGFQSGCAILPASQRHTTVLIAPRPCQDLALSVLNFSH